MICKNSIKWPQHDFINVQLRSRSAGYWLPHSSHHNKLFHVPAGNVCEIFGAETKASHDCLFTTRLCLRATRFLLPPWWSVCTAVVSVIWSFYWSCLKLQLRHVTVKQHDLLKVSACSVSFSVLSKCWCRHRQTCQMQHGYREVYVLMWAGLALVSPNSLVTIHLPPQQVDVAVTQLKVGTTIYKTGQRQRPSVALSDFLWVVNKATKNLMNLETWGQSVPQLQPLHAVLLSSFPLSNVHITFNHLADCS